MEAAREFGEDILQRCHLVLGPDHMTSLATAAALTLAQVELGEAEAARALGQDTLQRSQRVLGLGHPLTLYLTQAASGRHPMRRGDAPADSPGRPL